jgi:hypothetical protein
MNNDTMPACFGLGNCGKHSSCERYHAIETSNTRRRISTCEDIRGMFPLYLQTGEAALPGEHEANAMFPFGLGL